MRRWQAGNPEGRGGLAGAAQDPCLLSSLSSLWAAASSQGLSRPGRGCSALSVSPWHPPRQRRGDGSALGGWSWVSAQSSWGFPTDTPGVWSWALPLGLVLQGLCRLGGSGPSWGPAPRSAPAQSRPESMGPAGPGGGPRGAERAPASLLPSLLWLHVLGSQQAWISPGGSRGSLSAASGGWVGGWALAAGLTGENKWSSLVF